jgi:ATP-dependent DNA ligase
VKPRSAALRLPDFVEPMKAKLVGSMPVGAWIYEIKFDGYRALGLRAGGEKRILRETKRTLEANSRPSEIRLLHSMSRIQ